MHYSGVELTQIIFMVNVYVDISRVNAKRIEIKYITSELRERDIWIEVGAFNIYKRKEKQKCI